jgi:hypothetical protein
VQGVGGISDIITTTGDMNVDFADIKAVRALLLGLAVLSCPSCPHQATPVLTCIVSVQPLW